MKRLSKEQSAQREQHLQNLEAKQTALETALSNYNSKTEELWEKVQDALTEFNNLRSQAWGEVDAALSAYNSEVNNVDGFRTDVATDMATYYDERSEKWQEGDAGQSYLEWKETWEQEFTEAELEEPETVEMETPEPLDPPDLLVKEQLEELAEECPA